MLKAVSTVLKTKKKQGRVYIFETFIYEVVL